LFAAFFSGGVTLLSIFEPYSNFGRITNEVIKPAIYLVNNLLSSVLQKFDLYFIRKAEMHGFNITSFFYALVIFILIGGLSFFYGRFFCNTLCPAGALLGLISKFSVFRIKISGEKCNSCGMCAKVCKAGCIDCETKSIDSETCIYCFNCLDTCKNDGIKYSYGFFKHKTGKTDETKRDFMKKTMTGIITFAIVTSPVKAFANSILIKKKNPVILPPGAQSMENFRKKCTSCHLCVASCPTKVLTPAFNGVGLKNFLQPEMNYSKSYCLYDCNACSQVCPTGAIKPVPVENKKRIQIGVAKFIKDRKSVV
jgi:polyferredoxin